jgi:hypothetical protein
MWSPGIGIVLGVTLLCVGLSALVVLAVDAFRRYRGVKCIHCPETGGWADVHLDLQHEIGLPRLLRCDKARSCVTVYGQPRPATGSPCPATPAGAVWNHASLTGPRCRQADAQVGPLLALELRKVVQRSSTRRLSL